MSVWQLLLQFLLLIAGFILLIKGADFFVEGASKIADRFGIPQIIIGLTIVAFGTSAPEAAISISAALKGSTGIAIGNVVGSNIMNILLILGITSCIVTLNVQKNTLWMEMPFVIVITVALVLMGVIQKNLNVVSGIILWAFFIVFFIYLIRSAKKGNGEEKEREEKEAVGAKKSLPMWMLLLLTLGGLAGIVSGSNVTVDSASKIAGFFGMSDRLIGLTIVAFGTSLPELMTSIMAGRKGKADIAVGNIIGSNIFNILFVLGTTALIHTVPYDSKFIVDGIVAAAAAVLLLICSAKGRQLKRWGGILMLVCYAGYFVYLLQ